GMFQLRSTNSSVTTGDVLSQIEFYNSDASGHGRTVQSRIQATAFDNFGKQSLRFQVSNNSNASTLVDAMEIESNGNIGINNTNPDERLDVDGNIHLSGVLKVGQFTASEAAALSPENGDFIYLTSTDATFTSIGFWGRENSVWVKL
ncbi:MAG: hypothetical protein AAGJ82_07825, partial [Bacteroidota bacterium]